MSYIAPSQMIRSKKKRADDLLVEKGIAKDHKEAAALVLSGTLWIGQQRIEKAGTLLDPFSNIKIRSKRDKFVSRGGVKLEAALRHFQIDVNNRICLDLGASTGGFSDCLLQHGAAKVYAFDVGRGLLDWKLRQDSRVVVRESTNVRYLTASMVEDPVDLVTIDLAFISLRLILPQVKKISSSCVLALVKPQFEAHRQEVGERGIIRSVQLQREIVKRVRDFAVQKGFMVLGETPSPILGQKGNREYFLYLSCAD